ncbi:MAG: hypothetical protein LJE95_12600, partial [Acidobacteria bacterium]|nr:hypothetical protein [Acidobacteriota bacterium]
MRRSYRSNVVATFSLALIASAAVCLGAQGSQPPGPEGYYRQPAIHQDTVVFVAEGDLWRVDATGGEAVRLT